ncbi:MAG TPA: hypothetical protein VKA49_06900 [Flavitalea sp.]|nr:hypothetical protein [Flavitalea sp.]
MAIYDITIQGGKVLNWEVSFQYLEVQRYSPTAQFIIGETLLID